MFEAGERLASPIPDGQTVASGIRVPTAAAVTEPISAPYLINRHHRMAALVRIRPQYNHDP